MDVLLGSLAFLAGYAASIYTWPWLMVKVHGVESEIETLEDKLKAMKAAV